MNFLVTYKYHLQRTTFVSFCTLICTLKLKTQSADTEPTLIACFILFYCSVWIFSIHYIIHAARRQAGLVGNRTCYIKHVYFFSGSVLNFCVNIMQTWPVWTQSENCLLLQLNPLSILANWVP